MHAAEPVAKHGTLALRAAHAVAATVVAPQAGVSARPRTAQPRSPRARRGAGAPARSDGLELRVREAHADGAREHGDRRRHRAALPHGRLAAAASRLRERRGADDGALERDDRRRAATAARTSSRTTNARCVLRRLASSILWSLTSYNP